MCRASRLRAAQQAKQYSSAAPPAPAPRVLRLSPPSAACSLPPPLLSCPRLPLADCPDAGHACQRVRHCIQHQVAREPAVGAGSHHLGAAAAQAVHQGGQDGSDGVWQPAAACTDGQPARTDLRSQPALLCGRDRPSGGQVAWRHSFVALMRQLCTLRGLTGAAAQQPGGVHGRRARVVPSSANILLSIRALNYRCPPTAWSCTPAR